MGTRILLLLSVIIIGTEAATTPVRQENVYPNKYRPSPDRYNYFDAELLEVLSREKQGNVVISPVIVKVALEMLLQGASGSTADEIISALRLQSEYIAADEPPYRHFNVQKSPTSEILKIVSRVFVSNQTRINPEYQSGLQRNYGSDVVGVNFQNPRELSRTANAWVRNATNGLITKIADESKISPRANIILASAIYFKGKWYQPFYKEKTVSRCFYTVGDICMKVPMMSESGTYEYGYIPKLDAEVISLPYQSTRFSIILALPKRSNGLLQLARDMMHVSLDEIRPQLRNQEVYVEIPRFTVETNNDLVPYLKKLQILRLFGDDADLDRIFSEVKERVSVGNVLHSAKIVVNEEGTEAAAFIASLIVPLSGGTTKSFIANRPFLFFIRDGVTGAILFSGKIERPEGESKVEFEQPYVQQSLWGRETTSSNTGKVQAASWGIQGQSFPADYVTQTSFAPASASLVSRTGDSQDWGLGQVQNNGGYFIQGYVPENNQGKPENNFQEQIILWEKSRRNSKKPNYRQNVGFDGIYYNDRPQIYT